MRPVQVPFVIVGWVCLRHAHPSGMFCWVLAFARDGLRDVGRMRQQATARDSYKRTGCSDWLPRVGGSGLIPEAAAQHWLDASTHRFGLDVCMGAWGVDHPDVHYRFCLGA